MYVSYQAYLRSAASKYMHGIFDIVNVIFDHVKFVWLQIFIIFVYTHL